MRLSIDTAGLPPEQINKQTKVFTQVVIKQHGGILPPPEILAMYGEVVPGFPEQIVKMAEGQTLHRQKLENKIVHSEIINSYIGQAFAFSIVMTSILGGIYLIHSGKDATGLATIIGAIVGAASVFIVGRKRAEKDLSKSQKDLKERYSKK